MKKLVICPPMDHIVYNEYYKEIANFLDAKLIHYGRSKFKKNIFFAFIYTFKFFLNYGFLNIVNKKNLSYLQAAFLASKQRSIKESLNAKDDFVKNITYFLKNIYYYCELRTTIKKHKVVLIISTPEPYVESVMLRILSKNLNVPCIALFGKTYLGIFTKLDPCKSPRNNFATYRNYRVNDFNEVQVKDRKNYLNGLKTNYSGFTVAHKRIKNNFIQKNFSNSVVIYLPDFFDSPNVYGGNLFNNHLEWLKETTDFLIKNKINFFIKPHPNATKKSRDLLKKLMDKKEINYLNNLNLDINIFLQKKKPQLIITVYGHISIEAPYYGIDVVCAGSSPSDIFDFTYSPKSKKEYFNSIYDVMIKGIRKEKKKEDIILAQLCNKYKTPEKIYNLFIKNPGEDVDDEKILCMEDLKNKYYNDENFKNLVSLQINSEFGRSMLNDIKSLI